jgi:MFS transporter, PPP family, 3-phenylpropionic acid transporter
MINPAPKPGMLRFAGFYAALFLVVGVQLPYWPVWLKSRGLSATEIGILVAAQLWVKVGFNPLVGQIVDRTGRRRPVLLGLALTTLAVMLAFPMAHGFAPLLCLSLMAGAAFSAIMPVGDNLTLSHVVAHGMDYGRVRLWGSLSFIAMSVAAGGLLDRIGGDGAIVWLLAAALVPLCFTILTLPDAPPAPAALAETPRPGWGDLLRSGRYWRFLAATATIGASHAMYYGFGTLDWQRHGIDHTWIGGLWGIGVAAEVVVFAWSAVLVRRFGAVRLILIGALGGVARWTLMPFVVDPWLLLPLQCLHGLTFGATHLGAMHFLARQVAPELTGRALGLYAAMGNGVVLGVATVASGGIYAAFGGLGYLSMAVLAATGATAALSLARGSTNAS